MVHSVVLDTANHKNNSIKIANLEQYQTAPGPIYAINIKSSTLQLSVHTRHLIKVLFNPFFFEELTSLAVVAFSNMIRTPHC
jgi:hypothetical protein